MKLIVLINDLKKYLIKYDSLSLTQFLCLDVMGIKKPIVVIGGINNINYKKLINTGAKYIALSSFIWDNPKLKPEQAIRKFK